MRRFLSFPLIRIKRSKAVRNYTAIWHRSCHRQSLPQGIKMFKHILLPTDGTSWSNSTIEKSVLFAKEIGARITGFYAMPGFRLGALDDHIGSSSETELSRICVRHARQYLDIIEQAAKAAEVSCTTLYGASDDAYEAIIKTAEEEKCDLIAMASHGRKGVRGFLQYRETQQVLAHSRIPILVFH